VTSAERKTRRLRLFHLGMTCLWVLLVIPTLVWWKDSILWVAVMSVWANVAAHWSAYQGARAEEHGGEK
jgi:hypothetical protein